MGFLTIPSGVVQLGGGTPKLLVKLNTILSAYTQSTHPQTVIPAIENLGLSVIMTPRYNAMAEDLVAQNPINDVGKFASDIFDEANELALTEGFDQPLLNGHPYMGLAGYCNNVFYGSALMIYREYTTGTALKDLWYPNQYRELYSYVLNADGSTRVDTSALTRTVFSDGQSPGVNGYNSLTGFSSDDGSQGFVIGNSLDGNGGPYLRDNPTQAYGCENDNSGDSAADTFFWGQAIPNTTYQFYFFILKKA
jgi:hypothetical protein